MAERPHDSPNPQHDRQGEQTEPTQPSKGAPKISWYHRPLWVILIALIFVTAAVFVVDYFLRSKVTESTDDAFIDAHTVNVAPKVAGRVLKVHVDDNQKVNARDIVVEIDPRDIEATLVQRNAAVDAAVAKKKTAETNAAQAEAHLKTLESDIAAAKASATAAESDAQKANDDARRNQELSARNVISKQEFVHSQTAAKSATANLEAARKKVSGTEAQLKEGEASVAAAKAQIQSAEAEITQAEAAAAAAKLELLYTRVPAPFAGRVTNKSVEPGQYVQVGQALFALVPSDVWVTANYKESQITRMHPGQHAEISIDAYPGRKFAGHLDSIQRGSGAQFSLLPPENATGNYVKVVQRVPVKIVFDEEIPANMALGPGMSVVPIVTVQEINNVPFILVGTGIGAAAIAAVGAWLLLKPRPGTS